MKRVGNQEFLVAVSELLNSASSKGSVYLEQKRLSRTGPDPDLDVVQSPYPLIFRISDGARDRKLRRAFSTIVAASDLDSFWLGYTETLKTNMTGLRKKDKKKARK